MSLVSKWFSSAAIHGLCHELRLAVPWGHIAAKAWGCPDGWPVLCLHGWADNANSFDRLIPLLPEDFYYVALDFPGHGLSSHRPAGVQYYFPEYVADVRRIAAGLNWNKFTILGHSMGGNVGGLFCSIFPEMVDKLIVLDGYGFFPHDRNTHQEQIKKAIDGLLKLEKEKGSPRLYTPDAALKRLLEGNESVTKETGKILLQRGSSEVSGGLVFTRDIKINLPTPARITIEQCLELQKKITAAVLLILAEDGICKKEKWNPNLPPCSLLLEGYRNISKQNQVERVKGNHHVHLNEPEQVATIISVFLKANLVSKL
ncbi:serine hydrolase-like protein [Narcine bancroftii]|uniref:serine hydrolase-like protein n=1 Tax=Narcine bancroftii TaxID=1343680 RepID=UPI00383177F5